MKFKDHFSAASADYRDYRPGYPTELFEYLASLTSMHQLAWDCATGNGQAALSLSRHYDHVVATDASESQINAAVREAAIEYRIEPAERTTIDDMSVDLITVAQALHWFDQGAFIKEVDRVLKPDGVIAAWTYNLLTISPKIDHEIHTLYEDVLGAYWPPERKLVENHYRGIDLPFADIKPPLFEMKTNWNLRQVLGYLSTWSAVHRFIESNGQDRIAECFDAIASVWGEDDVPRAVRWPLTLTVWRKISK